MKLHACNLHIYVVITILLMQDIYCLYKIYTKTKLRTEFYLRGTHMQRERCRVYTDSFLHFRTKQVINFYMNYLP